MELSGGVLASLSWHSGLITSTGKDKRRNSGGFRDARDPRNHLVQTHMEYISRLVLARRDDSELVVCKEELKCVCKLYPGSYRQTPSPQNIIHSLYVNLF